MNGTEERRKLNANYDKLANYTKVFSNRESILTEMLTTNSQMKSAYNLLSTFVAVLVIFTFGDYALNPSVLKDDLNYLEWAFKHWKEVMFTWAAMHLSFIFIFFPAVRLRLFLLSIDQKLINASSISTVFTILYVCYIMAIFTFCNHVVIDYKLSPICSFAILIEMVRLIMKLHSYAIETLKPNSLSESKADEKKSRKIEYPALSQFLYFLVAPTLIYRNAYPRTKTIRWRFICWNFIHFLITIFCTFTSIRRFISANFSRVGHEPIDSRKTFSILAIGFLMGAQQIFLVFFGFLHCWHNVFAELMRFGDRQFYTSWWHCTKLSEFYRQWNILVQDWLYTYIYRPALNASRNKQFSNYAVIIISALVHEYLLAVPMRFLFPFLFLAFGVMAYIIFLITKSQPSQSYDFQNTMMFALLFFGWECQLILYMVEWYSRVNCPKHENLLDYVIPRFPSCVTIK